MEQKKTTDAQYRASQKYKKEKVKRITVEFTPKEVELLEHVQQQPNKQGYIKALIRADMEKQSVFGYARVATKEQITDKQNGGGEDAAD